MKSLIKRQSGSLLIVALIALIVLSLMGFAFLTSSNTDLRATGNFGKKTSVSYVAQSAVNKIALNLKRMLNERGEIDFLIPTPTYSLVEPAVTGTYERSSYISDCESVNGSAPDLEDACQYLADKFELSEGLNDISDKYNEVRILKIERDLSDDRTASTFTIPNYDDDPLFAGMNAKRAIYKFSIKASPSSGSAATTLKAEIGLYGIPLFQWLALSDEIISFLPGEPLNLTGRLHSNVGIRVGTLPAGGLVTFNPLDAKSGFAITTSGNLWQIFKRILLPYDGTTVIDDYKSVSGMTKAEIEASPASFQYALYHISTYLYNSAHIRLKTDFDPETFAYFRNYLMNVDYPSLAECDAAHYCWLDGSNVTTDMFGTSGFQVASTIIDADNPEFRNKVATNTDKIYPPWFEKLNSIGADSSEVIQPGEMSDHPEISDGPVLKNVKKYYDAQLKLVDGKSYAPDGSIYDDANPLSFKSLESKGIISVEPKSFYHPISGRNANVYKVDVAALKNAIETDSNFQNIDHVYVGTTQAPSGEVHYPSPNCDEDKSNKGYFPICMNDSGTDCRDNTLDGNPKTYCDPNNTGSFDAVMLINGSSLPDTGLTFTTNKMAFVQGDYNAGEAPAAVLSDSLQLLSNSWDKTIWDPTNPVGPDGSINATDTTYKFAYMSGLGNNTALELPLMEDWYANGAKLNKFTSAVFMWKPQEFPPKAGSHVFNNWNELAWKFYYSAAQWNNIQSKIFGANSPPGTQEDWVPYLKILSIEEIEDPLI